jgi:hypothetical protein
VKRRRGKSAIVFSAFVMANNYEYSSRYEWAIRAGDCDQAPATQA